MWLGRDAGSRPRPRQLIVAGEVVGLWAATEVEVGRQFEDVIFRYGGSHRLMELGGRMWTFKFRLVESLIGCKFLRRVLVII